MTEPLKVSLGQLMAQLSEQPAAAPNGWFRSMHDYSSVVPARMIRSDFSCNLWELWRGAVAELEHADAGVTEQFKALFVKHAWSFGTLGFRELAERFWPDLDRDARGRCLAGLASGLRPESETADWNPERLPDRTHGFAPAAPLDTATWMVLHLPECQLDAKSAAEIGCMSARAGCVELLEAILRDTNVRECNVSRQDSFGQPPGEWSEHLSTLSDRVVDLILEASVRGKNADAAGLALNAGANPNLPMWVLGGSFNEHYSALSYASGEGKMALVKCLLDAGADPSGLEIEGRNKPLYEAMNGLHWEIADLLLDRGAKFEGGNFPADARGFLGHRRDDTAWSMKSIGSLITLRPPETKPWFYDGNGQGGQYRGFMDGILWRDNLNALKKYEARGLPTELAVAELITALIAGSDDCLDYLLQKAGAPPAVYSRIRERYPGFGTAGGDIP